MIHLAAEFGYLQSVSQWVKHLKKLIKNPPKITTSQDKTEMMRVLTHENMRDRGGFTFYIFRLGSYHGDCNQCLEAITPKGEPPPPLYVRDHHRYFY